MAIFKGEQGLSLNVQRDYITLRTPNGNYTVSWSGSRASGKLAENRNAFDTIDNYVNSTKKTDTLGKVMESLLKPELLTKLWKDWNYEVKPNDFKHRDIVKFKTGSIFEKKFPNGGEVVDVKQKNVFIILSDTNELVGFDYQVLTK